MLGIGIFLQLVGFYVIRRMTRSSTRGSHDEMIYFVVVLISLSVVLLVMGSGLRSPGQGRVVRQRLTEVRTGWKGRSEGSSEAPASARRVAPAVP
jgi:hypothetical protein